MYAASHLKRAQISFTPWWQPQIAQDQRWILFCIIEYISVAFSSTWEFVTLQQSQTGGFSCHFCTDCTLPPKLKVTWLAGLYFGRCLGLNLWRWGHMMFCQRIFFRLNVFQFVSYRAVRRCAKCTTKCLKNASYFEQRILTSTCCKT